MLEKEHNTLVIVCDTCGDIIEEGGREDFTLLINALKDAGGRIYKVAGDWVHECGDCVKAEKLKRGTKAHDIFGR